MFPEDRNPPPNSSIRSPDSCPKSRDPPGDREEEVGGGGWRRRHPDRTDRMREREASVMTSGFRADDTGQKFTKWGYSRSSLQGNKMFQL